MGILDNITERNVIKEKAKAYDNMQQQARQKELARQAAAWGKQQGLAEAMTAMQAPQVNYNKPMTQQPRKLEQVNYNKGLV